MITTEEKIEIMQRERKAYKEGYRDGLCWVFIITAGFVCTLILIAITTT